MRYYTELACGCFVSCDGGGGLQPCSYDKVNPDCKFTEYMKIHEMLGGFCKVCDPEEFRIEQKREG